MIPKETDFAAKQEKATATTSSWSRVKDPRIVGVSRGMGGKDRHSKVCTVRGLRDRRVRLSVQTAIQLYDLQERLGLNQPSKVVDWLLESAKHEIDELPPLQIPQPTSFTHLLLAPQSNQHHQAANYNQLIPTNNHLMSSYTSFPSNLTLSQPPISLGLAAHQDQDFVYQSEITQPYFMPPSNAAFDPKHPTFHNSDLLTSSLTAPMDHRTARPFDFSMTADLLPPLHKTMLPSATSSILHRLN